MNKTKKKEYWLRGYLLRPVTVGMPAFFTTGEKTYQTSLVVAIHNESEDDIYFETRNTHYHLSTRPFPLAAISPLPVRLAACA